MGACSSACAVSDNIASRSKGKEEEKNNQSILIIWDFDKSLINDDSDVYLFKKFSLSDWLLKSVEEDEKNFKGKKKDGLNSSNDYSFIPFMNSQGYTKLFLPIVFDKDKDKDKASVTSGKRCKPLISSELELAKHLSQIGIYKENLQIVNKLYQYNKNVKQIIISCGHSLFIETILKENNIYNIFENDIYCNHSRMDYLDNINNYIYNYNDNYNYKTLIESPYLKEGNVKCNQYKNNLCSPHMCKGYVIDNKVLNNNNNDCNYDIIVYIGDGKGDYCSLTRLRKENDFAFVRKGFTLDKIINNNYNYNNFQPISVAIDKIKLDKNSILYWKDGSELSNCFESTLPMLFC